LPTACGISTVFGISYTPGWSWTIMCMWWSRRWNRRRSTPFCIPGALMRLTCWCRRDARHRSGAATSMTASCGPTESWRRVGGEGALRRCQSVAPVAGGRPIPLGFPATGAIGRGPEARSYPPARTRPLVAARTRSVHRPTVAAQPSPLYRFAQTPFREPRPTLGAGFAPV